MRHKLLDYLHDYRKWCRENNGEWTAKDEALLYLLKDYDKALKYYHKQKEKDNKLIKKQRILLELYKGLDFEGKK